MRKIITILTIFFVFYFSTIPVFAALGKAQVKKEKKTSILNLLAIPLAIITHEIGHSIVVLAQGGEVTDFQINRMNWEGDINKYSVNVGGVLTTRLGYYLTRNSKNKFIHTYSEACRLDLHYQVFKGFVDASGADLDEPGKYIPFAILSAIDLYNDRDIKISPLGISIKW